jgi:hypothetical protein
MPLASRHVGPPSMLAGVAGVYATAAGVAWTGPYSDAAVLDRVAASWHARHASDQWCRYVHAMEQVIDQWDDVGDPMSEADRDSLYEAMDEAALW